MNGIMHLMTEEKPENRRKVIIIYNGISEWNSKYDGAIAYVDDDYMRFDLDGEYSATPDEVYAWIYEEDLNKLLGI